MPSFTSDGLELAYDDVAPPGAERTIVLAHGFASNRNEGWRRTGWYGAFERRRIRCVALDQRGHGDSAKPHAAAAYGRDRLAGDVVALLDHLDLGPVALFGYSMGARVALATALAAPDRISDLILGGVGEMMIGEHARPRTGMTMAEAMRCADPADITEPMLKSFRQFADEQGEDRAALAACTEAVNRPLEPADMAGVRAPVLVVAGERDNLAGDPEVLAQAFPNGRAVSLGGCDHFSAIPHGLTKAAVFDFLDGLLDDPWAR
jgi:pimeloyl-ACP methyl ester carboxylesterase